MLNVRRLARLIIYSNSVANCSFETFLEFNGLCLDLWLRWLPLLKRDFGSWRG